MKEREEGVYAQIVRCLSGEADQHEREELIGFLEESNENRLYYFHCKRIWLESSTNADDSPETDLSWERLKVRMGNQNNSAGLILGKSRNKRVLRALGVAASISLLFALTTFTIYTFQQNAKSASTLNEVTAPLGSRTNLVLPDGSSVWLNSGSKLTYTSGFGRKTRDVSLSGEAFFDIRHQEGKPFTVNSGDLHIEVLGTTFNVKAYPEENTIETTLVKGKVTVKLNSEESGQVIVLKPNEKLIYSKNKELSGSMVLVDTEKKVSEKERPETIPSVATSVPSYNIVRRPNPQEDAAWKDGKLIIKSESLESLAIKLERHFNIEISFESDTIKGFKYSGTLDEVSIEEVLNALESTSPLIYSIDKNQVILSLKKK